MNKHHSQVLNILDSILQLGGRAAHWQANTPLLGSVAELDSMAVVSVLTQLEEQFGFSVADDEISAETFATVGDLWQFVDAKLAE
jgi:acyl carrier protein